ncbi:hypothetical protein ACPDHL_05305 [Myroides sp. C15-4]|uniref:hypothetical protein n=1 Tax=Myroides sp. C15-4 TaxID=3400532 RepID=UPI003D2F866B
MRILSPLETEELHRFVRQHYVEFYDVELELVDHLAHDIEAQWAKDATVSFEQALQIAFKKFGIFGFSDVVEVKVNRLTKVYIKMMLKQLMSFFTLPKIIFSIALYLILFTIGVTYQENGVWFLFCLLFGLTTIYMIIGTLWQRKLKLQQRLTRRKFLLETVAIQSYSGGAFLSVSTIFIQLPNMTHTFEVNPWAIGLIALLVLLMSLWSYIAIFILKPKLQTELVQLVEKYRVIS